MKVYFAGWQTDVDGTPAFPLFTIMEPSHPSYLSTVGEKAIRQFGFSVPDYPSFEDWKALKERESYRR